MRFSIISADGKNISNTLSAKESAVLANITSESILVSNNKARAGNIKSSEGQILAYSDDTDFVKSSQKFKSTARFLLKSLKYINEIIDENIESNNKTTNRLIHNLTSLNAHNIQEIYLLIPQDEISGKIKGHLEYTKKIVENNSLDAAKALLKIAKNNAAMKTEFSVFKKLFNTTPDLRPSMHIVHKVVMNILYLFFSDFTDKSVEVVVQRSEAKAYFDYESIHVALYHLINNAAKYTIPDSFFNIEIKEETSVLSITFRMCSTKILKEERERIFDEGYSGSIATSTGKAGNGIGMNIAKRIIELNNGTIFVNPIDGSEGKNFGFEYQTNEFVMNLPINKKPLNNTL
ncbi:sensor histidine kinase [Janthinobacterium sp. Mn2066]|uniref:sensor histidine kinase n=1 Tax=Janthinobacterium sp. Mn2066 TaxID=3395264 RepID=UPI003BBCCE01